MLVRAQGASGSGTYLALGSMAVEAGLGGAVAPALSVVHVEVELKVDHLPVELGESYRVGVHGGERDVAGRGEESVVGNGMRRRSEGDEPSLITKSIANTNERWIETFGRLKPWEEERGRFQEFHTQANGNIRTGIFC